MVRVHAYSLLSTRPSRSPYGLLAKVLGIGPAQRKMIEKAKRRIRSIVVAVIVTVVILYFGKNDALYLHVNISVIIMDNQVMLV